MRGHGFTQGFYPISVINSFDDIVRNDTVMTWYIPRVKANWIARNTYRPCHVVLNRSHSDELPGASGSGDVVNKFSLFLSLFWHRR
jgi:hypothetical protein